MLTVVLMGALGGGAALAAPETRAEWDALHACKAAIERAAQYKIVKRPPNRDNTGRGDGFVYYWPAGSFILQNGYGAEVRSEAICLGSLSRRRVTGLMVNGRALITEAAPASY